MLSHLYVDDFQIYLHSTLAMLQTVNPTAQWIASVCLTPDRSQIEFLILFSCPSNFLFLSCFMVGISGTEVLCLEMWVLIWWLFPSLHRVSESLQFPLECIHFSFPLIFLISLWPTLCFLSFSHCKEELLKIFTWSCLLIKHSRLV